VIIITMKSGIEEIVIHLDSCEVHNTAKTMKRFERL
jgi:hypothetical protein